MNLQDVINRTELVVKKYEKYIGDKEEKRDKGKKAADAFTVAYTDLLDAINDLNLKADEIGKEKNRALRASLNAELRRSKGLLADTDVPKLDKLVKKGKNLTKEILDDRFAKVAQVKEAIAAIPDGVHSPRRMPHKPITAGDVKGKGQVINIDAKVGHREQNPEYYTDTAETSKFKADWQVAKSRQDQHLDNIEKGLVQLKGIGEAMNETLQEQDHVMNALDDKIHSATAALTTNNAKLKGLVTKMRSTRNFCLDIILICIILGLVVYIWQIFKG